MLKVKMKACTSGSYKLNAAFFFVKHWPLICKLELCGLSFLQLFFKIYFNFASGLNPRQEFDH